MSKIQFSAQEVETYYKRDFANDLQRYFTIDPPCRGRNYPMIMWMDSRNNPSRVIDGAPSRSAEGKGQTQRNFIFAGLLYFMLLIPQTIRKVCGEKAEEDFYLCSGWPLSSAGMGGYLPPKQMLEEAGLLPLPVEADNFYSMLKVMTPFMVKEISDFVKGENQTNLDFIAYSRFREATCNHPELLSVIAAESQKFIEEFRPRLTAIKGDIFDLNESQFDAAVVFVKGGFNGLDGTLMFSREKLETSKIGYVVYRGNGRCDSRYRPYKALLRDFTNDQEVVDYIKRMIPESLDFALRCGNRIAFHGLQIHGWDVPKSEKLSVNVVREWLDEHPQARVTMVDFRGCFNKYLVEAE